jgi:isoleucyl-tRNA synthetase
VFAVREQVNAVLEEARGSKTIGKSQEARVRVSAPTEMLVSLSERGEAALAELFIVSAVTLEEGETLSVEVSQADGEKCPRCWNYRQLASDVDHPEVCVRCASVLAGIGR